MFRTGFLSIIRSLVLYTQQYVYANQVMCRSQWPRGLRRRFAAACLQRLWVRIPPETCLFVECCVLSDRGLCVGLITLPEESCRMWCVVCDLETSRIGAPYIYDISSLSVNPLKPELNPICYLLALLGAHHFLHVSRIRVKLLTLR